MDREILFRAKRKDNGEWVYGDLLRETTLAEEIITRVYEAKAHGTYIKHGVDPETVCQYTGLTDKNGRKIFEGDYISCSQYVGGNQIDYLVELGYAEIKHGAFGLHRKQGYYRPFKDWLEDYEYEVIGNIFENPELLEVEP